MSCCGQNGAKRKEDIHDNVKEYYGKTLKSNEDLKTTACVTPSIKMKKHVTDAMKLIHDDVIMKYYGCGLVVPECLHGMKILDLGSGSGRDCYALAKLVGEDGFVTGIDMTDEQLETANKYIEHHRDVFGFQKSNVKFVRGYIENLKDAGIEDNSIDIIISNCVINLCKDKKSVLQEAFRVLKDGGELYFSDIYADRELTDEIKEHKVLWGECISGALHWKHLYSIAKEIGFEVPRTVSATIVNVTKPELESVVDEDLSDGSDAKFVSVTYRLFKLSTKVEREPKEVLYNGEIIGYEDEIQFDHKLNFVKDTPQTIDGDTAAILLSSRFEDEFEMKKAKCCANPSKNEEIDPFVLASSDKSTNNQGNGGGCCPGSQKCC
ncbi:arsenite methyltransferase-like isoform X1 [Styela clava]